MIPNCNIPQADNTEKHIESFGPHRGISGLCNGQMCRLENPVVCWLVVSMVSQCHMSALGGADIHWDPRIELLLLDYQLQHHPIIQTEEKLLSKLKVFSHFNFAAETHSVFTLKLS